LQQQHPSQDDWISGPGPNPFSISARFFLGSREMAVSPSYLGVVIENIRVLARTRL